MSDEPISEWIARVLPLRAGAEESFDSPVREVSRFRIRILAPQERPGRRPSGSRVGAVDIGSVRLLCLDSVNPHGGVGGSFDSEQCAWLVRALDQARDRYVIVASHDGSRTLTSDAAPGGAPPRVLGSEVTAILLANRNVVAWISGTMHERAGRRHGDHAHGFWELPGATVGPGAPLAGGLTLRSEERHLHRALVMQGALTGMGGRTWELPDPFPSFTRCSPTVLPLVT